MHDHTRARFLARKHGLAGLPSASCVDLNISSTNSTI